MLGKFSDRGSENEVYVSYMGTTVYKLNDFRYSDDNLTAFFDRLEAHNHYFPDCGYQLIGFAENQDGKTCALLAQPFIVAEREATEDEIKAYPHDTNSIDGRHRAQNIRTLCLFLLVEAKSSANVWKEVKKVFNLQIEIESY